MFPPHQRVNDTEEREKVRDGKHGKRRRTGAPPDYSFTRSRLFALDLNVCVVEYIPEHKEAPR